MKSVLLVEDDDKVSLAAGIRLKAMGYEVITAADAVTAVSQARKSQPDVCLIDINLPGGDGFLVADRLRSLVNTASTPIIFITASRQEGLHRKAGEYSAPLIEKPFDAGQLADAIEMSLFSTQATGAGSPHVNG